MYPILYGVFIWFLYFERCQLVSDNEKDNGTLFGDSDNPTRCDISLTITIFAAILLTVNASWSLLEIYMLLRVDYKYLLSWRAWVIRVGVVVMAVTLWPGLFYQDGFDITWQYPIASVCI